MDEALAALWRSDHALSEVWRAREHGEPELIAQGYERQVPMRLEVDGVWQCWTERRLVVRSLRQAKAAEAALRARVAKAKAHVEALNQHGRGRKRFEEIVVLRQAVHEIVQRHGVEEFVWLRYDQHCTTRRRRAYRGRPAQVQEEHHATVEVRVDEEALTAAVRRLGWRMYGTPIKRQSSCRLSKPCWPIAVNISWSEAWGGSKVAR